MNTLALRLLAAVSLLFAANASATVTTSSSPSDFALTLLDFQTTTSAGTGLALLNTIGGVPNQNIKLIVSGRNQYYRPFTPLFVGNSYATSSGSDFEVAFSSLQPAFAFHYVDTADVSTFTVTFFNGSQGQTLVGTASFATSAFNADEFIGFVSDVPFNTVRVLENGSAASPAVISPEYFQFYGATVAVPEPTAGSFMVLAAGLAGFMALRHRKVVRP